VGKRKKGGEKRWGAAFFGFLSRGAYSHLGTATFFSISPPVFFWFWIIPGREIRVMSEMLSPGRASFLLLYYWAAARKEKRILSVLSSRNLHRPSKGPGRVQVAAKYPFFERIGKKKGGKEKKRNRTGSWPEPLVGFPSHGGVC